MQRLSQTQLGEGKFVSHAYENLRQQLAGSLVHDCGAHDILFAVEIDFDEAQRISLAHCTLVLQVILTENLIILSPSFLLCAPHSSDFWLGKGTSWNEMCRSVRSGQ